MPFYNREKEIKKIKAVLSGEPNVIWFVYGPINSGKTSLLTKVFEDLSEEYRIFYLNFRGVEGGYQKFTRAFFELGDKGLWERLKGKMSIISAAVEYVEKIARKINTAIELPAEVIKMLQVGGEDPEKIDLFHYLERLMKKLVESKKKPVMVLDEMQVLKDELNSSGQPLLGRLFNFLVRITKETHLCHSLCASSDCVFIESVYRNAKLDGRAKYLLVDDLDKKRAFEVYESFGFKNKSLVWDYIGGKVGDMVSLSEEKKGGYSEEEALERMLKVEVDRLDELLRRIKKVKKRVIFEEEEIEIDESGIRESLSVFKLIEEVKKDKIDIVYRNYLVEENVLFYNPMEGTIRPQSRLLLKAIRMIL